MDAAVQALVDERGVCDALYRYAEGVDLRDWEMCRSAFTDEITFDLSSYRPGSVGAVSADAWVERARHRFDTLVATSHTMTNPRVRLDGDTAVCTMNVEATHLVRRDGVESWCILGGRYRDDLVRAGDEWRICALRLEVRWMRGDRSIFDD